MQPRLSWDLRAYSAQKALLGFETETRELLGGMEENSVSPMDRLREFFRGFSAL